VKQRGRSLSGIPLINNQSRSDENHYTNVCFMCVYKKEEFYKEGTRLKVSIFSNISVVCLFIVMQRNFVAYIIA
jgi:hypothetical protein